MLHCTDQNNEDRNRMLEIDNNSASNLPPIGRTMTRGNRQSQIMDDHHNDLVILFRSEWAEIKNKNKKRFPRVNFNSTGWLVPETDRGCEIKLIRPPAHSGSARRFSSGHHN